MLTHDDIRSCFSSMFPEDKPQSGIFLVSRYHEEGLQLPEGRAHVFIPDCHLLSDEDAKAYPHYHFMLRDNLQKLLGGLTALKSSNRGELTVWQTGDLFDLWRSLGNRGDQVEVDDITASYAPTMDFLFDSPPEGLRVEYIAGNHDYALHLLQGWSAKRFALLENSPGRGDLLVLHGDIFSAIELLPIGVKEFAVRIAKWISSGNHQLDQQDQEWVGAVNRTIPRGDAPIGQAQAQLASTQPAMCDKGPVNVVFPEQSDVTTGNAEFFNSARELALALNQHGHDIRTIVIGHTHFARIVAGDRGDGVPFALMDCGAWLEKCQLSTDGPTMLSAQVGVLVGNEMRIYQIGSKVS